MYIYICNSVYTCIYCISVVSLKDLYPGMCIARKIVPQSYYHRDIDSYFLLSLKVVQLYLPRIRNQKEVFL